VRIGAVFTDASLTYITCLIALIYLDRNYGWLVERGAYWWPPMAWGIIYLCSVAAFCGSIGMKALGLKFASIRGGQIGPWHAITRVLVGVVFIPLSPISLVCAIVDRRRRSLADIVCRTVLCRRQRVDRRFEVVLQSGIE